MHKGFKCLDPSEDQVYISRDVVFDEHVFPFSHLHPNVRARLRAELSLLPDILLNPTASFGDAQLLDQSNISVSTNGVQGVGDITVETGEKNATPNAQNLGSNGRHHCHFMCPSEGGNHGAEHEPDSPAVVAGDLAAASLGSAPSLSMLLSHGFASNFGSSAAPSASASPTPPASQPQPNPSEGAQVPRVAPLAPWRSGLSDHLCSLDPKAFLR